MYGLVSRGNLTGLNAEELDRRIKAARLLRNISQQELAKRLAEDGLSESHLGKLERGQHTLTRAPLDALVRHLRVPETWFTEPDTDTVVGYVSAEELTDEQQSLIAEAVRLLAGAAHASDQAKRPPPEASDGQDQNGGRGR